MRPARGRRLIPDRRSSPIINIDGWVGPADLSQRGARSGNAVCAAGQSERRTRFPPIGLCGMGCA